MKNKYIKPIAFILLAIIIGIVSYTFISIPNNIELKSGVFHDLVSNNISEWLQVYSINIADSLAYVFEIIFSLFLLTSGIILRIILNKGNGENISNPIAGLLRKKKVVPFDVKKINKVLPDFNPEEFKNKTYNIYMEIQKAWMNFDNLNLRNLVTDEMYNMYLDQLELFKINNKQNIIEFFNLSNFEIIGMDYDDKNISITANYEILCNDYIIDIDSKAVLKGSSNEKVVYLYEMVFVRSIIASDNNNFCPNCGAPTNNKASKKCNYCNSVIVSSNHDWVLSQKRVLKK